MYSKRFFPLLLHIKKKISCCTFKRLKKNSNQRSQWPIPTRLNPDSNKGEEEKCIVIILPCTGQSGHQFSMYSSSMGEYEVAVVDQSSTL